MMRVALVAALLTACGGGGADAVPFGWWNGRDTSGALSIAEPGEYANARARGQMPIVIVWTSVQQGGRLVPGWRDNLKALVEATPDAIGYYAFDEPGLAGVSAADQDAVTNALPYGKIVMMSLSTVELASNKYVPKRVNLLGVNLYSSAGVTVQQVPVYLDLLAGYGRPMYLNLDAAWITQRGTPCNVPEATQRASIALNEAILGWGAPRNIGAHVAFIWQSGDDGVNQVCGAVDMPLVRRSLETLAGHPIENPLRSHP
jgi:hypothetical protein